MAHLPGASTVATQRNGECASLLPEVLLTWVHKGLLFSYWAPGRWGCGPRNAQHVT